MSSLESNIFFMARRRKSFRPKFAGKLGRMDLRKVNSFFQLALLRKGRSLFFKPFLDIQLMTSWWNFFDQTNSIDEKQSLLYYIKQPTGTNCFQNCVLFAFLTLLMALKRGVRLRVGKQKNQLTYKHESSSTETLKKIFHLPIPEMFPVLWSFTLKE